MMSSSSSLLLATRSIQRTLLSSRAITSHRPFYLHGGSGINTTLESSTHHQCGVYTQTQIRGKKKEIKRKHIQKEYPEGATSMWQNPELVVVPKKRDNRKRPAYKQIVLRKDNKIGYAGEIITLKSRHAYKFVLKKSAVLLTDQSRAKYVDSMSEEQKVELAAKRRIRNKRTIVDRATVEMRRRIAGPMKEFFWPVTARDIVNRVWNVYRVALKESQLIMPASNSLKSVLPPEMPDSGVAIDKRRIATAQRKVDARHAALEMVQQAADKAAAEGRDVRAAVAMSASAAAAVLKKRQPHPTELAPVTIKKPGLYPIFVDLEDGLPLVMMRLYLRSGGNTWEGW